MDVSAHVKPGPTTAIGGAGSVSAASGVLAGAAIVAQVAIPLLNGDWLRHATVVAVLLFVAAALTNASAVHGPATAFGLLTVVGGLALATEAIGVHTGMPFGRYAYSDTLGPKVFGVPLIVPLAWVMMTYPCLLLGRRLTPHRVAFTGAAALTAWDLFLDPQMVAAGYWRWSQPTPSLPGIPGVPLTNFAGWALVAVAAIAVADRLVPDPGTTAGTSAAAEAVPAALLAWTWLGSTVGNLAFFGRPVVACYGGVALGATVAPYLRTLARRAR